MSTTVHPWEHPRNTEPVYDGVEDRGHHPYTLSDALGNSVSDKANEVTESDLRKVEAMLVEMEVGGGDMTK